MWTKSDRAWESAAVAVTAALPVKRVRGVATRAAVVVYVVVYALVQYK